MKIKQLKALIADLPDDMEVVVSSYDHSYVEVGNGTRVVKAEVFGGANRRENHLFEYYGEEHKSDPKNKVIEVFWIDDGRY